MRGKPICGNHKKIQPKSQTKEMQGKTKTTSFSRVPGVAVAGPSGTGKTTIVKYIAEKYNIPFFSGSASEVFLPDVKMDIEQRFGFKWDGHRDVIQKSNMDPEFGKAFQEGVLYSRYVRMQEHVDSGYITDRSPLDALVFAMYECGAHYDEYEAAAHVRKCLDALGPINALIYVPNVNWEVEENGSRVANPYFQEFIGAMFDFYFKKYVMPRVETWGIQVLVLDKWDLEWRKKAMSAFIELHFV